MKIATTSMHSSSMRTARLFTVWGVCIKGGLPNLRGVCIWGICPTPGGLHPGGLPNLGGGSAQPQGGSASGGWSDPPAPWKEWHTGVKTLPCPKLRLRAVNMKEWRIYFGNSSSRIAWKIIFTTSSKFFATTFPPPQIFPITHHPIYQPLQFSHFSIQSDFTWVVTYLACDNSQNLV